MPTKTTSFDVTLKKRVASVCDLHRIPCGSPADLKGFLKALDENKLLAMDFWGIVNGVNAIHDAVASRSTSSEAHYEAPTSDKLETQTLNVIVRVLTGMSVSGMTGLGGELKRSVDELKNLISGEDMHFKPVEGVVKALPVAKPDYLYALPDGSQRKREDQNRTVVESGVRKDNPAWNRILSTDWIAADAQAKRQAQVVEEQRREAGEPMQPGFYADRDLRRLLLEPERVQVIEGTTEPEGGKGLPAWVKLPAGLGDPRRIATVLGCLALVMGFSLVLMKARQNGVMNQAGSSVHNLWNELAGMDESEASATEGSAHAATTGDSAAPFNKRKAAGGGIKLLANAEARGRAKIATGSDEAPKATGDAATSGEGDDTAAVEVLAEVMRANLIVAPPAISTKPGQADGHVVMRVVISKGGVVGSMRVVEGDPALAAVATQTVATWRYRPYLVNGTAVAVKTTVTVNVKVDP